MMFTHKNLMTVCCATVLAFGLAACGGGDDEMAAVIDTGTDTVGDTDGDTDGDAGPTPEEMAAAVVAATKAAATKVKAIDKEAGEMGDASLGGIVPTDEEGGPSYVMTIKRDSDGTTVEIEDPANPKTADPKFIQQDVDLGEGRIMLVRVNSDDADGKVEEVVIVKTDINAAKATAFATVEMLTIDRDLTVDTDGDDNRMNDFTGLCCKIRLFGDVSV